MTTSINSSGTNGVQYTMKSAAAANPGAVVLSNSQVLQNARSQRTGSILAAMTTASTSSTSSTSASAYSQAAIYKLFAKSPAVAALLAKSMAPTAASVAATYGTGSTTGSTTTSSTISSAALPAMYEPFGNSAVADG